MSRLRSLHQAPILCYVTDRRSLGEVAATQTLEALLDKIEAGAAARVDWIQIREKDLCGKECALLVRSALQRVARASAVSANPARILVNDRLDVALSERAGGVHLGENSLPLKDAKRLVTAGGRQDDFLTGVSCHSLEAARGAAMGGADYLFFGPVFATPSKAVYGEPQGLARLAEVCRAVPIPVLAIGGITRENSASCLSAGAAGIAAIRLFQDSPDISPLVRALRKLTL